MADPKACESPPDPKRARRAPLHGSPPSLQAVQQVLQAAAAARHPSEDGWAPLPGGAGSSSAPEAPLDVWALSTRALSVTLDASLLLRQGELLPLSARRAELEEDGGDLQALGAALPRVLPQLVTELADGRGGRFHPLPEQVALAAALAAGCASRLRGEGYGPHIPRARDPRFAMLVSPPGSGKSAVALMAALHSLGPGWEAASAEFEAWRARPLNGDPLAPGPAPPGRSAHQRASGADRLAHERWGRRPVQAESARLARVALIAAPEPARSQWRAFVQASVALQPPGVRPRVLLGGAALFLHLAERPADPALAVVSPATLREYFDTRWSTGLCFLCLDEVGACPWEAPRGGAWGAKPIPSVRTVLALSAGAARLLHPTQGVWTLRRGNLLRGLLLGARANNGREGPLPQDRDSWRRVALATLAPGLQLRLGAVAAEAGPAALRLSTIRLGRTFAQEHLGVQGGCSSLAEAASAWVGDVLLVAGREAAAVRRVPPPQGARPLPEVLDWLLRVSCCPSGEGPPLPEEALRVCSEAVLGPNHRAVWSAESVVRAARGDQRASGRLRVHDLRSVWNLARRAPCACAACGQGLPMRQAWVCPDTCRYLCEGCSQGGQPVQWAAIPPSLPGLRDLEGRGTRLEAGETLLWVVTHLCSRGLVRLVLSAPRGARLPGLGGATLHELGGRAAWARATLPAVLLIRWDEPLAGLDLAGAQALIMLGVPPDQQELCTRVLRLGGAGAQGGGALEAVRLLHPAARVPAPPPQARVPDQAGRESSALLPLQENVGFVAACVQAGLHVSPGRNCY